MTRQRPPKMKLGCRSATARMRKPRNALGRRFGRPIGILRLLLAALQPATVHQRLDEASGAVVCGTPNYAHHKGDPDRVAHHGKVAQ